MVSEVNGVSGFDRLTFGHSYVLQRNRVGEHWLQSELGQDLAQTARVQS